MVAVTVSISVCVILRMSVITQDGWSALTEAVWEGKTEAVVELVKAGANVDMQNEVCLVHVHLHVCDA